MEKDEAKAGGKKTAESKTREGVETDFRIGDVTYAPETQPREGDGKGLPGIYAEHVEDLRKAVRNKVDLPRVRIWRVVGKGNFITDGHHTTAAYRAEGHGTVPAEVFEGEWWEAVADAAGANKQHLGLKRTNADKRRAVLGLLEALAAAGERWSNRRVAAQVGVSDDLVAALLLSALAPQPQVSEPTPDGEPPRPTTPEKVEGADGKTYPAKPRVSKNEESNEPTPTPTVGPIPVLANPASTEQAAPAPVPKYDIKEFEVRWGRLYRQIDELGRVFAARHSPDAEELRQMHCAFKAKFEAWHAKLIASPRAVRQTTGAGPSCPECGGEMLPRTRKATGKQFLGCRAYPDCQGTRAMPPSRTN